MTTLADIQSGNGVGFNWVLLIEGCEIAVTDASPSAIVTLLATDATLDWSDAVCGLSVLGGWEQSLEPWEPSIQVGRLSFAIKKDTRASTSAESDIFAELVFGQGNGFETYLDASLDCNDATVTVLSTSTFPASGVIHIGTEAIAYTGKTATTFTGCVRGKFAPFKANTEASQRFGQAHRLANVGDGVVINPKVTSKQREWTGRRVGLFAVSNNSTAWSDAQCVWAGRIESTRDGTNGLTYIECIDIKGQLRDCELMRHQWSGRIQEGIYLQKGWRFSAVDVKAGTTLNATDLVVVDASPGANKILKGVYTLDELADALNEWFADERAAARLGFNWRWQPVVSTTSGSRSMLSWSNASAAGTNQASFSAPSDVMRFMGYRLDSSGQPDGRRALWRSWEDDATEQWVSAEEPRRLLITGDINDFFTITVEGIKGTRFDARTHLPNLGVPTPNTKEWGVFQVGGENGPIALFSYAAADQVTADEVVLRGGVANQKLDQISGTPWVFPGLVPGDQLRELLYSEEIDLEIRQVGLVAAEFATGITKMIASTGTSGYNHASYDTYPQQLGAGVPWELLGTNWTSTLAALSSGTTWPLTFYIPKPTKLTSVIGSELVARVAQIIWKNEGLRVASWGTPTAARALHSFTESNKRVAADATDAQRTSANLVKDYLVNRVRILWGRGDSKNDWTIIDPGSQDTYGTFDQDITLPSVSHQSIIEAVADNLASLVPMFSRPLALLTRTISVPFYEGCAPGDFCTITDNFARDPSTGTRGLSSKPALIVRHAIDWGGHEHDSDDPRPMGGTIDVLILPLSNIAAYSPCAEVDFGAANAGYDAANQRLTLEAHEHSESSEVADATRFQVPSAVRVVEIDPADPAAPLTWTTVVAAQSGNTLDLDDPLTGWDNTKRYRVISQVYSAADSPQRVDVYQADDADGMVEDQVGAYVYGTDITQAGTWTDDAGTEQVALYAELAAADGAPLDTGYEKDAARLCNNLVNYRTAIVCPVLTRSVMSATVTVKRILSVRPINLQPGALLLGERPVFVRPMYRSNDGTLVTISVSLCTRPPTGTSREMGDADAPAYRLGGEYETLTWTTSSTTWGYGSEQSFSGKTVDQVTGKAYLVIESNSTRLETRGLAEVWQDAYDEAA